MARNILVGEVARFAIVGIAATVAHASVLVTLVEHNLVGLIATLTHVAVVIDLVEHHGTAVLLANGVAFLVAVVVSYIGHYKWTFGVDGDHRSMLPRFILTAIAGFALNQTIMYVFVTLNQVDYRIALAVALTVVPALSFVANKLWVFLDKPVVVSG